LQIEVDAYVRPFHAGISRRNSHALTNLQTS
jgi:hypothetical protein